MSPLTRLPKLDLPDAVTDAIDARLARATDERVAERLFAKDDTLWGESGQDECADRLGWLDIHDRMLAEQVATLQSFAHEAYADGLRHAVVLGMGGSSLAPLVFAESFGPQPSALELHVLDSTDAQAVRDIEAQISLDETLFIVSSKSGGTVETLSALHHFWEQTGHDGRRFVAITDPGSGLEELAQEREFRAVFHGDPDVGGRYSALSPFGIVPAAVAGIDIAALLKGASVVAEACRSSDPYINPGVRLGITLGELALSGRDKLTFFVDGPVSTFGLWVEQLIAESLGKHGKGILPIADEPVGAEADYGPDRVIAYIRGPKSENLAGAEALPDDGFAVITCQLDAPQDIGALMMLWEFATAVAGWVLELNPFDQPNVQSAKSKTSEVLEQDMPPEIDPAEPSEIAALLDGAPPSYVAIQAYCAPSKEVDEAAAALRERIRAKTKMATTFGYGPRYLHSTGQLHKGGPDTGRFLQILLRSDPDIEAGEPAGTFETLKRAQADGDLLVLRENGLPAERVLAPGDAATAMRAITERL